jgi:arabinofuranan 3-O-arabinosyltransferase
MMGHRFTESLTRRPVTRGLRALRASVSAEELEQGTTPVFALLCAVVALLHSPGKMIPDTKIDVAIEPLRFLGRTLHLWEPLSQFGHVQNQVVGYLFPMGSFFGAGKALGIAPWLVQRAWIVALLVVAFHGMRRLAAELGVGVPWSRSVGAFCFATGPGVLAGLGTFSAAVLGTVLAPWVILPLVGVRRGSSTRRRAAASALAVVCIGGINATVTLGALLGAALFIGVEFRGSLRTRLAAWWTALVLVACLPWLVALGFQARYGFNFLPYTERAETTASAGSALDTLRGTGNWINYLGLTEPWSRSGSMLVHSWLVTGAVGLVSLSGLVGLTFGRLPVRRWLGWCVSTSVIVLTAGYSGAGSGLFGGAARAVLNGPGVFARNMIRLAPSLRMALALGTMHLLAELQRAELQRRSRRRQWGELFPASRGVRSSRSLALLGACAVMAGSTAPAWTGRLVPAGAFVRVPAEWSELLAYLDASPPSGRLLVVPTSAFAEYDWGRPLEEPLQFLSDRPWVSRSLIPLGSAESVAVLDVIEDVLAHGTAEPGLPAFLSRVGVSALVVRNDLDWRASGSPRPTTVRRALFGSGMAPIRGFGRPMGESVSERPLADLGARAAELRLPPLELWSSTRDASPVSVSPLNDAAQLVGDASALLAMSRYGLVDGIVTSIAGSTGPDAGGTGPVVRAGATVLMSDTQRREAVEFGLVRNHRSYTLTANEPQVVARRPLRRFAPPDVGSDAVAVQGGVKSASASSYGSWLIQLPEVGPPSAVDGDMLTAWVAADEGDDTPWFEVELDEPTVVESLSLSVLLDGPWRQVIGSVDVVSSSGERRRTNLRPTERPQLLAVPPGTTSSLRLTLRPSERRSDGQPTPTAPMGIRELQVNGQANSRRIKLPDPPAGTDVTGLVVSMNRQTTSPFDRLRSDAERSLNRSFRSPIAIDTKVLGTARPEPLDETRAMWLSGDRLPVNVTASSVWDRRLWADVRNAFDGNPATAWIPEPVAPLRFDPVRFSVPNRAPREASLTSPIPTSFDPAPSVTINWRSDQRLSEIVLTPALSRSSLPTTVRLTSPAGVRTVELSRGVGRFEPLVTNTVTITTLATTGLESVDPLSGRTVPAPIAVAEIRFSGVDMAAPLPVETSPFTSDCGAGPDIVVDGAIYRTRVSGIRRDLVTADPVEVTLCDADGIPLSAGEHTVVSASDEAFVLTSLNLVGGEVDQRDATRSVDTEEWGPQERLVRVGAGAAAVLTVHENQSRGWTATLNGVQLEHYIVDGWQQGFVVPAGDGGVIRLAFTPQRTYRWLLLGAWGLLAVLPVLALAGRGRTEVRPTVEPDRHPRRRLAIAALLTVGLSLAGAFGVAVALLWLHPGVRRFHNAFRGLRGLTVVVVACGAAGIVFGLRGAADSSPSVSTGSFGLLPQLLITIAIVSACACLLERPDDTETPSLT